MTNLSLENEKNELGGRWRAELEEASQIRYELGEESKFWEMIYENWSR